MQKLVKVTEKEDQSASQTHNSRKQSVTRATQFRLGGKRVERESSRVAERQMTERELERERELEESLNPPLSCGAAADPLMQQSHSHTGGGTTSCRGSAAWTSGAK